MPLVEHEDKKGGNDIDNYSPMPGSEEHDEVESLFELAPLGPGDLLSQCRCREGPGNWWGGEDCLRVDEQGCVVLMDPDVYFEVCSENDRLMCSRTES